MSPLRRCRPLVETVEPRALLSTALGGSISGSYSTPPVHPVIAGQTVDLNGSGTVTPLGTVQATGTIEGVGSVAHGHATGAVTIAGTAGNLTLELSGPAQRGGAPLPTAFHYTILDENGSFPSLRSAGDIALTFKASSAPKTAGPGQVSPTYIVAPSFMLKFER